MTQPNRLPLPGLKPKDLVGIPWRVAFALQADGWTLRSDIIWHKPNCMPESVKDRPTRAHEYLFLFSKSERYYYDHEAIREAASYGDHVRNMDSPYCVPGQPAHHGLRKQGLSKSGNTSRRYGEDYGRPGAHRGASVPWEGDHRNKRSVWSVSSRPCLDAHFATFRQSSSSRASWRDHDRETSCWTPSSAAGPRRRWPRGSAAGGSA